VDLLPKLCLRLTRIHMKVAPGEPGRESPDLPHWARLCVRGAAALEVALGADDEFARALAHRMSGLAYPELTEEIRTDSLVEFASVVCGTAVSILEREGVESEIEPPRPGAAPAGGYPIETVPTVGSAALVLTPL
jgi:hypothetical protein